MQKISKRLPRALRVARTTTTPATYNTIHTTIRKMSLFPRFVENEFAPVFRLLDAAQEHALTNPRQGGAFRQFRSFQPKFDVKETKEAYELHGELPGIEQKNINIEFTDPQTITIKGRTEHHREEGQRPSGWIEGEAHADQGKLTDGKDTKAKQPTVEDEAQASGEQAKTEVQKSEQQQEKKEPQARYWVSERSVGEFARTFSFPTRVDQDNVKASLKDGILSIIVPKAPAPTSKRINIE
jgi:HSP20 family protein